MRDVAVIGARRAYIYSADVIRLSQLTNAFAISLIKEAFSFDYSAVASPSETFGLVPVTSPPGLVFYYGSVEGAEGSRIPVRFINIEPERVVIDVAGPSSLIDKVFDQLVLQVGKVDQQFSEVLAKSVIDKIDQSDLRFRAEFDIGSLVAPAVMKAIADTSGSLPADLALVPSVTVRPVLKNVPFQDYADERYRNFFLDIRLGFPPDERILASVAPLSTDDHQAYLRSLENALR